MSEANAGGRQHLHMRGRPRPSPCAGWQPRGFTAFVLGMLVVGLLMVIGGYEPATRHSSTFQSERLGR